MKIIFDLDGTLICSKRRLYELFCDLTMQSFIDFESYWNLKFNGYKNEDILMHQLGFSNSQINEFLVQWMNDIENDYYLSFDSLIPGVLEFLSEYYKNNDFYICTARQSIGQANKQLKDLGILGFFNNVFVTGKNLSKENIVRKSDLFLEKSDWFVGDTGHDITTGKGLGVKTCAVLSGFMSEASLKSYNPHLVLSNVTKLKL